MKKASSSSTVHNPYSKKRPLSVITSVKPKTTIQTQVRPKSNEASALIIAAADKAGMQGIDRARIDAIILRESGNSLFMQQQRRRDEKVNVRIQQMKQKVASQGRQPLPAATDAGLQQQIQQRPNRSLCCVVDMDMFYMACELLSRPDLKDKPACVGGRMILTSNYCARQYGVRSAMAGYIGDALVRELSEGTQQLMHVPSNFGLYKEKSQQVCRALRQYDPLLRAYSLDEAFLNLGPYLVQKMNHPEWSHEEIRDAVKKPLTGEEEKADELVEMTEESEKEETTNDDDGDFMIYDSTATTSNNNDDSLQALNAFTPAQCLDAAAQVLTELRHRVFEQTGGLTCSAGLAPNFLLAKIASDYNKPNGQCLVPSDHESIKAFLWPLPIRKVSGIGRVTEKMCNAFGIYTVQELYEQRALVQQVFPPIQSSSLQSASVGCSRQQTKREQSEEASGLSQKGISRERTFAPMSSWEDIEAKLAQVAELLSQDMQRKELWAQTLTVKVKLHNYDVLSRARSGTAGHWQSAEDLARHATELLTEIRNEFLRQHQAFSVRLLGIRCTNFREEKGGGQMHMDAFLSNNQAVVEKEASDVFPGEKDTSPPLTSARQQDKNNDSLDTGTSASPGPKATEADPKQEKEPVVVQHETALVDCPVCGQSFPESENEKLNQHVDSCLNGSTVRQAIREEDSCYRQKHKKRRLSDFFGGL